MSEHIVLLGDHGPLKSGRVVRLDRQLVAELDQAGVAWREPSRRDLHIAAVFVPEDLEARPTPASTSADAPARPTLPSGEGEARPLSEQRDEK